MVPDVTVRVEGARELRAALRRARGDLSEMKAANAAALAVVVPAAAVRAPRRSGRLAGSIRGNRAAGRARISAGGAAVPYAEPIHWGWEARNIKAQPFVLEAAVETEPVWTRAYKEEVDRIVARVEAST